MEKKIVLASNNKHKLEEYKKIFSLFNMEVISQSESGVDIDVDETGTTFIENAIIKAKAVYDIVKIPVISDDSGIEIDYLGGKPGVYSHRFFGENTPDIEKCKKVLELMKDADEKERTAKFRCAICYIDENGVVNTFEGICEGKISKEIRGNNGFCYDLIFLYGDKTFAEIPSEEKNKVSHRRRATDKLIKYLENK